MMRSATGQAGGAFSTGGVRELNGYDEHAVSGTDTFNALRLISNVTGASGDVSPLTASERDRLLASIYQRNFGERIRSTTTCSSCSNLFDLDFSLGELLRVMQTAEPPPVEPEDDDIWRLPTGVRFRVPAAEDEIAVAGLDASEAEQALATWCVVDAAGQADAVEQVASALDEMAPLLCLDMNAVCPECAAQQSLRFDIQEYLLRRLLAERSHLLADIHRLATAYGWSLESILALPRQDRRAFVSLIETEASLRNRSVL